MQAAVETTHTVIQAMPVAGAEAGTELIDKALSTGPRLKRSSLK